jgi:hypothetical protein
MENEKVVIVQQRMKLDPRMLDDGVSFHPLGHFPKKLETSSSSSIVPIVQRSWANFLGYFIG